MCSQGLEDDNPEDYMLAVASDFEIRWDKDDKKFVIAKLKRKQNLKAKHIVAVIPAGDLGQDGCLTWKAMGAETQGLRFR